MHFCLANYRHLLSLARQSGWRFAGFEEPPPTSGRVLLLRHDVDFSVEMALEQALVNAAESVRGTFFLLLRADVYNLLSPRSLRLARRIAEAGQNLALHVIVPESTPDTPEAAAQYVLDEFSLLRRELPMARPAFAWHNPMPEWLARFADLNVPGLVNAYASPFIKAMTYRSDSNLRHTVADFAQLLEQCPGPLHLLFHPVNWVVGGGDMIEVLAGAWARVIREREADFRTNSVYQASLPDGMPESLLDNFARAWEGAARVA